MSKTQAFKKPKRIHSHVSNSDIEKIKNLFAETLAGVSEKTEEILSESLDDLKERTAPVKDTVGNYIAEKPVESLVIAVLTGIAIGLFLGKKY